MDELRLIGKVDYLHVFSLLIRMRQVCDHRMLLKKEDIPTQVVELGELIDKHTDNQFETEAISQLKSNNKSECPICFEHMHGGVLLPCLHVMCKPCLEDMIETNHAKAKELECPICRKPAKESDLLQMMVNESSSSEIKQTLTSLNFKMSAKLRHLIPAIKNIVDEKIIVFR